jgi:hypothetical protein
MTMKRKAVVAAFALIALPLTGALAETLAPSPVFEGEIATPDRTGAVQPLRVNVQSWGVARQEGAMQELPIQGFYIAHLRSGSVSTTIDGHTTKQAPGAYWAVKAGSKMQIKVDGEIAVLETITISKP